MQSNTTNFGRCMRGFAAVATLTAASVMLSAHQTATYTDSSVLVTFGDIPSYWCFIFANYLISAYGTLLVFLPRKSQLWQLVVALDSVLVVILSSSCSAALAVGIIERNGIPHARWESIYHQVPSYCARILSACGIGFVGVVIYLLLLLLALQAEFNSILIDITL
ncbi:CASP-like protein 1C2 [Arachis duranensis]|uniref:CASP-like protein n=2 Tax=Arachis TaxID=3817 RepID=A0A6P4C7K9_ARADU|nr:CASP-like protein 1C2 [Arachis duranensis]